MRTKIPLVQTATALSILLAIALAPTPAIAQSTERVPLYTHPAGVSSSLRQVVAALGDRVHKKGKERVTLLGTIEYQGKNAPIAVVKESPGFLRIEITGSSAKTIIDDLDDLITNRSKDEGDIAIAELFGSDTAEGFLQGISRGGSLRKIGDGFVVHGMKGFAEVVDIYDLYAPASAREGKPHIQRQYMFDSASGLLSRVRYSMGASGVSGAVQVVLSDYQTISGYQFPGRIVRIAGGTVTHTFTLLSGAVAPKMNDNVFTSME
jgi:hypothetical protein